MLTEEQYDQSAVNFSKYLLLKVEEGQVTLETLQEKRQQEAKERDYAEGKRSYVLEGYDMAIAQLQQLVS